MLFQQVVQGMIQPLAKRSGCRSESDTFMANATGVHYRFEEEVQQKSIRKRSGRLPTFHRYPGRVKALSCPGEISH